MDRQAGAEIEVTPEMIEAGVDVALSYDSEELLENITGIVPEIYRAMCSVALECRRKSF